MGEHHARAPVTDHVVAESERIDNIYRAQRRLDYGDPCSVRRDVRRRIAVARHTGVWDDPAVDIRDDVIAAGPPQHSPSVRTYRPAHHSSSIPVVLYMHGGGFVSGDLDLEHARCLEMCRETGCAVVSVDYRLAPECPFPAGLEDCLTSYRWLLDGAGALGVDPARIAVAGISVGATLAAALSLWSRDAGQPVPQTQVLLCPVLDDRLDTPSMRTYAEDPAWDRRNCEHIWNHYLGPVDRRGTVSPYAAPARATDLSGLPATYLMIAEHDPLRDEAVAFAGRLSEAGTPVELHQFPRTSHGFDTVAPSTVARRARREQYDVLRATIGRG